MTWCERKRCRRPVARSIATTPRQALTLLHHPLVLELAQSFADRVDAERSSVEHRVLRAYRLALGRPPDGEEAIVAAQLVGEHGTRALARALFNSDEFVIVE